MWRPRKAHVVIASCRTHRLWVGRLTVKAGGQARLDEAALNGRQLLAQQRHIRVPALRIQCSSSTAACLSISALRRTSTSSLCNHEGL